MCTNPSYKDGVIEEFYDYNQPVMITMDIENIMLISRHICITESLPDICKTIPLAIFDFCYPLLYCCLAIRMSIRI